VPVIVIVGGGFAGSAVAQQLERRLGRDEAEIVLLSRENYTLFTPMLPEVTAGALEVRHIVTPVRTELRRTAFILADVTSIEIDRSRVGFRHVLTGLSETLEYDHLVLALGSSTSTFGLPGVAEHAWSMKSLEDADALRNRFVWLLELADTLPPSERRRSLLTIAVVGGGFTGVETAGEMVELFRSVLRFYPQLKLDEVRVVLLEAGKSLLPGLPTKMGEYSQRNLERRGVEVILGDGVASGDENGLTLQSGRRIDTATIVWSAGVAPSPTIAQCGLPTTKRGAVMTRPDMRVPTVSNVWALGDCAAIPDGERGTYPMTAQHAIREGPHLADNIVETLRGRPTTPFHYRSLGMMASLGARRAVAQLPGDRVLTGFAAWFLWRSYYLLRLPGLDRKLRVAFDWTLDLIFPRDIAELRMRAVKAPDTSTGNS
jgi:NADH:quinone reductase (non-electrogenic)